MNSSAVSDSRLTLHHLSHADAVLLALVLLKEAAFAVNDAIAERFAKLGGEMVPLQLVEELAAKWRPGRAGQMAAVSVSDGRKGERIVLIVGKAKPVKPLQHSGTGSMPAKEPRLADFRELLCSGKTDYAALKARLTSADASSAPGSL
ncbi:hypothetical protein ACFFK0_02660 [Paenibacillus chartarius]|uniref:Uncharacterized protein n=1 Tax=Paenibacillus chartarius TaxID=747481 RepID=A0ABV6DFD5_9BACL